MDAQQNTAILASLDQIHEATVKIRSLVSTIPPPQPTPAAPQAPVPWAIPVKLDDPKHSSRALRGGRNEFLPDGVMRVTYPVNEAEGGVMVRVDYSSRVLVEFEILFERPFDFAQGLKIFRIQSFDESKGLNNWDVILVASGAAQQAGVSPMVSIEAARNAGAWWGSSKFSFQDDTWHKIGIELRKGEVARPRSGAFMVSVDGKPVLNLPSVEVIQGSGHFADGKINRLHFGGWYSNGAKGNPNPNPAAPVSYRIRNASHIGA